MTPARPIQQQLDRADADQRHGERRKLGVGQEDRPDQQELRSPRRTDTVRVGTDQQLRERLQDQRKGDRHQKLLQSRAADEAPVDQRIHPRPQRAHQHQGDRNGDKRVDSGQREGEEADIHADHHQLAVREVDNAHDPEREAEARGEQTIDAPDEDPAQKRLDDFHVRLPGRDDYWKTTGCSISYQKSSTSPVRFWANLVTTRVPIFSCSAALAGSVRSSPLK